MKKKLTKRIYEQELNEVGRAIDGKEFHWVRGTCYNPNTYGSQLRRHDPIAFEVGFEEWKSNNRHRT